jgi:hypothetical protein
VDHRDILQNWGDKNNQVIRVHEHPVFHDPRLEKGEQPSVICMVEEGVEDEQQRR